MDKAGNIPILIPTKCVNCLDGDSINYKAIQMLIHAWGGLKPSEWQYVSLPEPPPTESEGWPCLLTGKLGGANAGDDVVAYGVLVQALAQLDQEEKQTYAKKQQVDYAFYIFFFLLFDLR